jgi:predicted aspartyl protease
MNARSAVLSVITGGGKWVEIKVYADPLYQHLLLTAEKKFWRCMQNGERPVLFGIEDRRVVERLGLQGNAKNLPGSSALGKISSSSVPAGFYFDEADYSLIANFLVSDFSHEDCDVLLGMDMLDDCRVNISRKKNLVEFGANVILPELAADARKEDGYFGPLFKGQRPSMFSPMLRVSIQPAGGGATIPARALVDTGAQVCVFSKRLVNSLNLNPVGTTDLAGGAGVSTVNTYAATIIFPTAGRAAPVTCGASDMDEFFDLIIGWTVLGNWSLHFSIKDNIFRFVSDPL